MPWAPLLAATAPATPPVAGPLTCDRRPGLTTCPSSLSDDSPGSLDTRLSGREGRSPKCPVPFPPRLPPRPRRLSVRCRRRRRRQTSYCRLTSRPAASARLCRDGRDGRQSAPGPSPHGRRPGHCPRRPAVPVDALGAPLEEGILLGLLHTPSSLIFPRFVTVPVGAVPVDDEGGVVRDGVSVVLQCPSL